MSNDRIEHSKHATSFVGPSAVNIFRMITLVQGLKMEIRGMRLTLRAPTCYSIIKREYGLKGNKARVLAQFEPLVAEAKAAIPVVED